MDPASFSPSDDIVSFVGQPGASAQRALVGSTQRRSTFVSLPSRQPDRTSCLLGPQVRDAQGNALDQDGDGQSGESLRRSLFGVVSTFRPHFPEPSHRTPTWSGLVTVRGMITVAAEQTLTVVPGTVVKFSPTYREVTAVLPCREPFKFSAHWANP